MGKHPSDSSISDNKPAQTPQGIHPTPGAPAAPLPGSPPVPELRRTPWFLSTWFVILAALTAVACLAALPYVLPIPWTNGPPAGPASKVGLGDEEAVARWANWSQAPATADERLCMQFIQLKNRGDPAADKLLGPAPAVPKAAVSKEEADRLQTEFFLRQDVRFVGSGRDKKTGALVLYTKGNVSAPTLEVRTETGVDAAQRTMANPDLVVEVRDGKVYGVASRLHLGP